MQVSNLLWNVGESTTDLSMGIIQGRIPGGVAIFWQKKYHLLISVIRLEVDFAIAIKVGHDKNAFLL